MLRPSTAVSALLLTVAIGAAAPACASGRYYQRTSSQRDYRDIERFAYDNGYRQGFRHGERDAADRRGYRIDRDREYRNADIGYRYGDRGDYRRFFRNGYEAGYRGGLQPGGAARFGNNRGGIFPPVSDRADGMSMPRRPLRSGTAMAWKPDATTPATVTGTIPRRSKRYREGDHDYDSRYGSRDQYKQEYRAAFQQGYEQGYRDNRR